MTDPTAKKCERSWQLAPGDLRGAAAARREFSSYLRATAANEDERFDAALIFGELVANAVKHARSSVSVELLEDGWTALRVIDDGDCFDASNIAPQPASALSGRGLYIVNQLARRMKIAGGARHCEVLAELPVHV